MRSLRKYQERERTSTRRAGLGDGGCGGTIPNRCCAEHRAQRGAQDPNPSRNQAASPMEPPVRLSNSCRHWPSGLRFSARESSDSSHPSSRPNGLPASVTSNRPHLCVQVLPAEAGHDLPQTGRLASGLPHRSVLKRRRRLPPHQGIVSCSTSDVGAGKREGDPGITVPSSRAGADSAAHVV